jgi:hypothetical protein
MFGLMDRSFTYFLVIRRSARKPQTLVLAASLMLGLSVASCGILGNSQPKSAANQGSNPSALQQPPSTSGQPNANPAGDQQGGKLTIDQLGDALTSYGKNTVNDNGQVVYSITVPSGKWKINVIISMSPNGNVIWMTNSLTAMPDLHKTSVEAMVNVLKKNRDIGPMFFEITGGSLAMTYPVPNHDLTEASFRTFVDAFVSTVVDNAALWDPAAVATK